MPKTQIPREGREFPADAFITQRAVLTALGRQYTLNGYLALSRTNGMRLIVTENFGKVMADVLIKPDGPVFVMGHSPQFKEKWIRRYVAADLQCIFGSAPEGDCPGEMLSPTHFVIQRRWYKLDLNIVETRPGPQEPALFSESVKTAR